MSFICEIKHYLLVDNIVLVQIDCSPFFESSGFFWNNKYEV